MSQAAQWFTVFIVKPRAPTDLTNVLLQIEFATGENESDRFLVLRERPLAAGTISVRMPSEGGEKGLRTVESFAQWARSRAELVNSLKLGPAPTLTGLVFRSYLQLMDDRVVGGVLPRERIELEFGNFHNLGLNSIVLCGGVEDSLFAELAPRYGITHAMLAVWAEGWRYTSEAYAKNYDFQPGESVPDHWERVLDDYYVKSAKAFRERSPHLFGIARHINLGDEIGPACSAQAIRAEPAILACFHEWLRAQGNTPQVRALGESWESGLFGAASWDAVEPLDDPAGRKPPSATPTSIRRFYWTRRFLDYYTELFYATATRAVRKYVPHATSVDVNYQAGPMQMGFLGNDNAYETMSLDILEMGRRWTFLGVKTEDWYGGNDAADGCCLFGAEILRAAARKHDLPITVYLVGCNPYLRIYLYLMQGVREIDFYQYGPYSNIGPAWAEHRPTLQQIGRATRELATYQDVIAQARRRTTRAAMLVAYTTDIMQARGPGFGPERQQLYIALQHSGIAVDVVSEGDIVEEGSLANYALLYVADPQVRADVQKRIAAWVKDGGTLWVQAGGIGWDEYGRPSAILKELLGVRRLEARFQPDLSWARPFYSPATQRIAYNPHGWIKATRTKPEGKAAALALPQDVRVWGARVEVEPADCQVLARYDDGGPAVLLNHYGQGKATLVGGLVGEAYAREHWPLDVEPEKQTFQAGEAQRSLVRYPLTLAGVRPALTLSVPGLYSAVLDAPEATLVCLVNASKRSVTELSVQIEAPGRVSRVTSLKGGNLKHRMEEQRLVMELPLVDTDIIFMRH